MDRDESAPDAAVPGDTGIPPGLATPPAARTEPPVDGPPVEGADGASSSHPSPATGGACGVLGQGGSASTHQVRHAGGSGGGGTS
ncbi:hypothetical protein T484DRAFT_1783642 [Baffinella frigidus]|nr:hypothetical protein T484DRAFT_1783642 [Cryptophyta sp. CCMP2293]